MTINYEFKVGWETARGILFGVAVYIGLALKDFQVPTDWQDWATAFGVGLANVVGTKLLDAITGQSGIKLGDG